MGKLEKLKLRAVYEKDVEKLLNNLGILEKVKEGAFSCHFCKEKITMENFGGIIRMRGKLELFCEKIECYLKMLEARKSR